MMDGDTYGLIGQMKAAPGKRDALVALLRSGTGDMPGNRLYMIAEDKGDPDSLWVVEAWDSAEAHAASLKLPSVIEAIGKARPIIAGFGTRVELKPVTGV